MGSLGLGLGRTPGLPVAHSRPLNPNAPNGYFRVPVRILGFLSRCLLSQNTRFRGYMMAEVFRDSKRTSGVVMFGCVQ